MYNGKKTFDVMKWLRDTREKMYEENKHLSTHEYFKKISDNVKRLENKNSKKQIKTKIKS